MAGRTDSAFYSGVRGRNSGDGDGVTGTAGGATASGVKGRSLGGGFGVYGQTDSAIRSGVYGQNDSGPGVSGRTTSPYAAVSGQNDGGGYGVVGQSNKPGGVGVSASAQGDGGTALEGISESGIALRVEGRVEFSRSGRKRIPAGAISAVVSVAGVTASSLVLATAQVSQAGCSVRAAVPTANKVTIWLTTAAPAGGLPVGWFIIG